MSDKHSDYTEANKASPFHLNVGAGLTRNNLFFAGSRPAEHRPLQRATSLTPAIKFKISEAALPTASRTHSERYQSAYRRLGGQGNTRYTEFRTINSINSNVTTTSIDGADINQSNTPRRGSFSTILTPHCQGRDLFSKGLFARDTNSADYSERRNNVTVGTVQADSRLQTDSNPSQNNLVPTGTTQRQSAPESRGYTAASDYADKSEVNRVAKFNVIVSNVKPDLRESAAASSQRAVPKYGKEVVREEASLVSETRTPDTLLRTVVVGVEQEKIGDPVIGSSSSSDILLNADNIDGPKSDPALYTYENMGKKTLLLLSKANQPLISSESSNFDKDTTVDSMDIKRNLCTLKSEDTCKSNKTDSPDSDNVPIPSPRTKGASRSRSLKSINLPGFQEVKWLDALHHGAKSVDSPEGEVSVKCKDTETDIILAGVTLQENVPLGLDARNSSMTENYSHTPVAKPRTKRRLTRRVVSFKKVAEDEFIGFASLPEQVHRKAVRRGFEFTLMVVGETGLGKSTLINSLFLTDLYKDRKVTTGTIEERICKTIEIEKRELEIEEKGVKLKLTIVDTPGFNDAVNAEESWKAIMNFIDKQFEAYFKAESGLNRKNIQDTRVHCCLYFISPYGHGLRPVDILVMKKLHNKVNIVPLIAKSDMLTKQEVTILKERVLSEIENHKIQIYRFPECDSDEDEDFKQQDRELKKSIPFAVVGSNTVVEAGGRKIRGRMYPWGIVEVENPLHCDFIRLRQMLISTHMQDLKEVTCDTHYENYRAEHITQQMSSQQKERGKLKRDSIANIDQVLDTDRLLQEKEAEIKRMQEMLVKMQAQLSNQNSPQRNGRMANV